VLPGEGRHRQNQSEGSKGIGVVSGTQRHRPAIAVGGDRAAGEYHGRQHGPSPDQHDQSPPQSVATGQLKTAAFAWISTAAQDSVMGSALPPPRNRVG